MPQRTIKVIAALTGVLWTLSAVVTLIAVDRGHGGVGAAAILLGLAAIIPTTYMVVSNVVDRSRMLLLTALLDALERTEQDEVKSISRR